MTQIFRTFIYLLIIQFLISSCGSDDSVSDPGQIELDITSITMEVNEKDTLIVITDIGGAPVLWESSNPAVAIINNGEITALSPGTATVTATLNDASATCEITVIEASLTSIELDKTSIELEVTDRDTIKVITDIGDSPVFWESSKPEIVTVGVDGELIAMNSGSAIITATVDGASATCEVTVNVTIFLGGSAGEFEAAYWKNGEINYLTTTGSDEGYYSWVNSIKVLHGNIYAGGQKLEQDPIVWKNNEEIILDDNTSAFNEVEELAIGNNTIYAAGGDDQVFLWNETDGLSFITDGMFDAVAKSIFVEGNDVYIGGYSLTGGNYRPTMWKNGISLILDYEQYTPIIDVFVKDGNFYACGAEFIGSGITQARYFKNTNLTNLTDESNWALTNSILLENNDLYIAGEYNRRPAIWINGELTFYEAAGVFGSISEILFFDGDLYAVGSIRVDFNYVGVVWKNGEELFRTDPFDQGHINSIDIK